MASSVRYVQSADTGDLGKYIGGKIKAARQMAAEERKVQKEQGNEGKTGQGYFFGKALAREFGGDKIARTKGFFSKNPAESDDPALSKKERFQRLVRGEIESIPTTTQLGLEGIRGDEVIDGGKPLKSWLTPLLETIANNNRKIADGISDLGEKTKQSVDTKDKGNSVLDYLKGAFKKFAAVVTGDDFIEQELELEKEELERKRGEAEDAKAAAQEQQMDLFGDNSDIRNLNSAFGDDDNKGGGKGGLGGLIGNLISEGLGEGLEQFIKRRKPKIKTPNVKPRGLLDRLNPFSKNKGAKPDRYADAVNTSRRNASNIRSKSKFGRAINFVRSVTPLSEGKAPGSIQPGLYNRPTTGSMSGQAAINLDRNNDFSKLLKRVGEKGQEGSVDNAKQEAQSRAIKATSLASGALAVSNLVEVLGPNTPPEFAPILNQQLSLIADGFDLPLTTVSSITGPRIKEKSTESKDESGTPRKGSSVGRTRRKQQKKKKEEGFFGKLKRFFGFGGNNNGGGRGGLSLPTGSSGKPMKSTGGARPTATISSRWGKRRDPFTGRERMHYGIDISGVPNFTQGSKLHAIMPGKVVHVGDGGRDNYGKYVVIEHKSKPKYTLYGHMSRVMVNKGDVIDNRSGKATVLGMVGSTGLSTGPHLHFSAGEKLVTWQKGGLVIDPNSQVNPIGFIDNYVRGTPPTGRGSTVSVTATPGAGGLGSRPDAPQLQMPANDVDVAGDNTAALQAYKRMLNKQSKVKQQPKENLPESGAGFLMLFDPEFNYHTPVGF